MKNKIKNVILVLFLSSCNYQIDKIQPITLETDKNDILNYYLSQPEQNYQSTRYNSNGIIVFPYFDNILEVFKDKIFAIPIKSNKIFENSLKVLTFQIFKKKRIIVLIHI